MIEAVISKLETICVDNNIKILDIVMNRFKTNISPIEVLSLGFYILNIGAYIMKTSEYHAYKSLSNLLGKDLLIQWNEK